MFDHSLITEANRQLSICNACRYCEGYCAVFPAIAQHTEFGASEVAHLANLCHNCRACYYSCQYTLPHEFALNVPQVLDAARQATWQAHAWPRGCARLFARAGVAIAFLLVLGFAGLFGLSQWFALRGVGVGFYAFMSHSLMVAIFAPAFVLPLLAMGVAGRSYWRAIGGGRIGWRQLLAGVGAALRMRHLRGGHGAGCNYEDTDRFSNWRLWFHHATFYGFAMCFASTSSGTLLHYGFGMAAPYGFFSLPKLLGVPGGILLCVGTAGLVWLKLRADRELAAARFWGGELAFVGLLFFVSFSGLVLYAATGTDLVAFLLPLHLGSVLTFFLLTPYTKMVHGVFRLLALLKP